MTLSNNTCKQFHIPLKYIQSRKERLLLHFETTYTFLILLKVKYFYRHAGAMFGYCTLSSYRVTLMCVYYRARVSFLKSALDYIVHSMIPLLGEAQQGSIFCQSVYQPAPVASPLGDVGWGDALHGEAYRGALHIGPLAQGLGVTDNIHATIVAVLLRGAWLLHKAHLAPGAKEGFQLAGDAPRVEGVAPVLRVIVGKVSGSTMVDEQAPVGPPGRLVGVVVDSQEDQAAGCQVQGLQENSQLLWTGSTLYKLCDLWANKRDGFTQAFEALRGKVLKGKTNDLVIEPMRTFQ